MCQLVQSTAEEEIRAPFEEPDYMVREKSRKTEPPGHNSEKVTS